MYRYRNSVFALLILLGVLLGYAGFAQAQAARPVGVDGDGVLRWSDSGEEVALFGVNYYAPHVFDYDNLHKLGLSIEETIDRDLIHFVRMGLDALRLHVFDREISDPDGHLIENDHLRLLDYLIARAKERGIYTVLTPIAWWPGMTPNSGFSNRFTMPQMMTDPEAWKAQCTYLTEFLNHENAFTHRAIKDDPAVPVLELINEPQYPPEISDAKIVEYVNTLVTTVRATGCAKPIFYNGWGDHYGAVRDADLQGSTFGWYPSGLCALRSLTDNFLPRVSEYLPMRDPAMAEKAKIVYEFDAADIPTGYIYPAMARSFRTGGAQIATQFQYDPLPLAPYNVCWQTHYLNLVYAPNKAVSFIIACEAFHTLPRGESYGAYPESNRFGAFRVSYEERLSEMASGRAFMYSNDTKTMPPAPDRLERVVGCGSSPMVQYDGTGAYFLDRLGLGAWRLEVYPDAVWVADPYGQPSLDREVSRAICRTWPMKVCLPDLGKVFEVEPLNEGNTYRARPKEGRFPIKPGVYVLRRPGAPMGDFKSRLGLREFVAPDAVTKPDALRHDPVKTCVRGTPITIGATVAASDEPGRIKLHYRLPGSDRVRSVKMQRVRAYQYEAAIPVSDLGDIGYFLSVRHGHSIQTFPGLVSVDEASRRLAVPVSRMLFEAAGEMPDLEVVPEPAAVKVETVADEASHPALRVRSEGFKEVACSGVKIPAKQAESDPACVWNRDACVVVRARNLLSQTIAVEIGLIEDDGSAHGQDAVLTSAWRDIRIPFRNLRPLWGTAGTEVRVERIAQVSCLFGAWQFGADAAQPHAFEIESVRLEPAPCCWKTQVIDPSAPVSLFDAECGSINIGGFVNYTQRMVAGMTPGRLAFRLSCPEGFGPPPSCIGIRQAVGEDARARRAALARCNTLVIRARAAEPSTTGLELALIELDDTAWGTNISLTREWREIDIPLSDLHYMAQWKSGPANRGGQADRLHPENLAAVNLCFGAWLFPNHASNPHGIEIDNICLRLNQ